VVVALFEVLIALTAESTVFWDVMPCSPVEVLLLFGGTYYLHLQGRRVSQAGNQQDEGSSLGSWGQYVRPKH
jgi:hypothetical protein